MNLEMWLHTKFCRKMNGFCNVVPVWFAPKHTGKMRLFFSFHKTWICLYFQKMFPVLSFRGLSNFLTFCHPSQGSEGHFHAPCLTESVCMLVVSQRARWTETPYTHHQLTIPLAPGLRVVMTLEIHKPSIGKGGYLAKWFTSPGRSLGMQDPNPSEA